MNSAETILLIIEDKQMVEHTLLKWLAHHFNVLSAFEALEGLQLAVQAHPSLILLDSELTGMNGFDVCQSLKENPLTQAIPVIFITPLNDEASKLKAFEVDAADCVTKPIHYPAELLARINTHLKLRRLQKTLETKNKELEAINTELLERSAKLEHLNIQLKIENHERTLAEAALARANQDLQQLVVLDALTKLANRRRFDEYLQQEWYRMARERQPLSIVLCDVDFFKYYNDTYGHPEGDNCLIQVAKTLKSALKRPADLAARYGGEEFALILPNTGAIGATQVAENIKHNIQKLHIPHHSSSHGYVTLSLGVTSTIPDHELTPEKLVFTADQALYSAKHSGRNCVVFNYFELLNNS